MKNLREREAFDAVWGELSEAGACDAIGGREYERVLDEWEKAGKPDDAREFIRIRANVGPHDAD